VIAAVVRRPRLWSTALRQWVRLTPRGWWHRRPFLPVPDRHYLGFRMQTQYGDPRHRPATTDVISYLTWCREWQDVTS
jgi:hypothetical protein